MAAGIYVFGRAFFPTPWGPAALLATTAFGAWMPFPHTGGHSPAALLEGTGYPAVTAYGIALLLWGWGIRVLDGERSRALDAALVAIIALLVPQHQMGAGIALIGLTAFGVAWPSTLQKRFYLGCLTTAGLILAAFWPYFDPYAILMTANRPEWNTGMDFYSTEVLAMLFLPIIVGLYWLPQPLKKGAHLPIFLAGCGYLGLYGLGALGSPVAHRMILPVVLLLEILLAVGLIRSLSTGMTRWNVGTIGFWAGVSIGLLIMSAMMLEETGRKHNYLKHAEQLVSDLPSDAIIAGHFLTAGPFNAIGRKTLSSPMTEPLVEDMPQRRALNEKLFDPTISREERRFLMRKAGVSALVVDEVWIDRQALDALIANSGGSRRSGPLIRLDP